MITANLLSQVRSGRESANLRDHSLSHRESSIPRAPEDSRYPSPERPETKRLSAAFWALEQDPEQDERQDYALAAALYRTVCAWDPDRGHEPYPPSEEESDRWIMHWYHKHSEDGPTCSNEHCAESSTWPPREQPEPEGRREWWKIPPGVDPAVDRLMARYPRADAERRAAALDPKERLEEEGTDDE